MKYQVQISKVVEEAMKRKPKGRFLFLTLTVENVAGEELSGELSRLSEAFNRLMKYKKVSKNIIGFLRATEVTRNELMNHIENYCQRHGLEVNFENDVIEPMKEYIIQKRKEHF